MNKSIFLDNMEFKLKRGYYRYTKMVNREETTYFLHRYIWEKQNGAIPYRYIVYHKDGNRRNNNIINLQLLSWKEYQIIQSSKRDANKYVKNAKSVVYDNHIWGPDRDGYLKGRIGGRYMRLHRYIWEKHYGPIPNGYIVHHKDKNILNNDISNLELLTTHEHNTIHKKGMIADNRDNMGRFINKT